MKEVADVIAGLRGDQIELLAGGGGLEVAGTTITGADLVIQRTAAPGTVVASSEDLAVALDILTDPELEAEGMAREVVSRIQQLRREAGLAVTDRIEVAWSTQDEALATAIATHGYYISREVLATELTRSDDAGADLEVDGSPLGLRISRS